MVLGFSGIHPLSHQIRRGTLHGVALIPRDRRSYTRKPTCCRPTRLEVDWCEVSSMEPRENQEDEALAWRFSTLHRPGNYLMRPGKGFYWSGERRYILSDQQSEWNAAAQLRALDFRDVELTPVNCVGIDIRSPRLVAQVKREVGRIGLAYLFIFYEACQVSYLKGEDDRRKEMWYFSASEYTKPAIEYADLRSILLFTYAITGELTPINQIAKDRFGHLMARRAKRLERLDEKRARAREAPWYQRCSLSKSSAPVIPTGTVLIYKEAS